MTEEDTFNRLRKTPYNGLEELWDLSPVEYADRAEFFSRHGWTYKEFVAVDPGKWRNDDNE